MHRGMYGFTVDRNKTLASEAFRAVSRIYGAGIMIWDGKIGPGGNNVMADAAAEAFTSVDIVTLHQSGDPLQELASEIISLRQEFAALSVAREQRRGQPYNADLVAGEGKAQGTLLQQIYDKAQTMEAKGWKPDMKPHRMSGPRPV
jgi:hypothetical protein